MTPGKTYHIRAYAINASGVGYGDDLTFNTVWVDDSVPVGATQTSDGGDSWNWISSNPSPLSGTQSHKSNTAAGEHQHYFINATSKLVVQSGDKMYAYVYLDPQNPPSEVMLQWNDGSWEHRAYWGANNISWGTNGTSSRMYVGPLPTSGQWTKLEIPAIQLGLENHQVNGIAFTLYGGCASWDRVGSGVTYAPTVTTNSQPTNLTSSSVTIGGSVDSDGGDTITEYGATYSNNANPTINDTKVTSTGPSNGFTVDLSNLSPGTKYHYRGYAINGTGTSYGNDETFTTTVAPIVQTTSTTNISSTSTDVTGNVTDDGGKPITERGVVYSTSLNPTILNSKKTTIGTTGEFTVSLDSLILGTTYHVRAFATNSGGTSYGTDFSFIAGTGIVTTNSIYNIQSVSATVTGEVVSDIGSDITERGIIYSTNATPTLSDSKVTVDGTSGEFSADLTGLTLNTKYYIRSYCINEAGISYGNILYFTTSNNAWVDDDIPVGGTTSTSGTDSWNWTNATPSPVSGSKIHTSDISSGTHQHYFSGATNRLYVPTGAFLYTYVYIDPENVPSEIMLQWNDGSWEHRAYWGSNLIGWGTNDTDSRRYMGSIPSTVGQWIKLEIPASDVGLEGHTLNGMAFTLYDGSVSWDKADCAIYSLPTVTTKDTALNITSSTAIVGGIVVQDGGSYINERGIVYSTSSNPIITDSKLTTTGTVGTFYIPISGLTQGTVYHYRAYAVNSKGISYGADKTFTTTYSPTVLTVDIINDSPTSAVGYGNITSDGGQEITERGFVYSTTKNPTTSNSKVQNTGKVGTFSSEISNLTFGTAYHLRSYAINSAGTSYGEDISFTAGTATLTTDSISNVMLTTATANGNITSGTQITQRGFVYSTSINPTISNSKIVANGTTTGEFSANLTGLLADTAYYLRSYCINAAGTSYGNTLSFTTTSKAWVDDNVPTGGNSQTDGGDVWNWVSSPLPVSGSNIHQSNVANGEHQHYFYGASKTLYVPAGGYLYTYIYIDPLNIPSEIMLQWNDGSWEHRAYWGTNSIGWGSDGTQSRYYVGSIPETGKWLKLEVAASNLGLEGRTLNGMAFTLFSGSLSWDMSGCAVYTLPTVVTKDTASNITASTSTIGGTIVLDGGSLITESGIAYSENSNPTISGSKVISNITNGNFIVNLSNLLPGKLYHYRAYAINGKGVGYGLDKTFTTTYAPTVLTLDVVNSTATTATVYGKVTSDGSYTITARGAVFSTSENPVITNSKTTVTGTVGTFSSIISNLTTGITYHVRSYATNSEGTSYGDDFSFIAGTPVVSTDSASNIILNSATVSGNVITDAGNTITERGFVYSTSQNPTIQNSKINTSGTTGTFSLDLTNLNTATKYYFKAYAVNSIGISYGKELSFTTKSSIWVDDVVPTGGNATSDGGDTWNWISSTPSSYSGSLNHKSTLSSGEHQHYFSGATNKLYVPAGSVLYTYVYLDPTTLPSEIMLQWNDGSWEHRAYWGSNSIGWGTNDTNSRRYMGAMPETDKWVKLEVPANLVGLEGHTLNGMAYTLYNGSIAWDMSDCDINSIPTVTTSLDVDNITATTATLGGCISFDGGSAVTERGIVLSKVTNPTIGDTKIKSIGTVGSFTVDATGLSVGITYHYRAYAVNSIGTAYGNDQIFTTSNTPTVSTLSITNISVNQANVKCIILSNGGKAITERGIVYSTSAKPTTANSKLVSPGTIGSYSVTIGSLTVGTLYHVRAFATNMYGTSYGEDLSFTAGTPIVTTDSIIDISAAFAKVNGTVVSDVGNAILERGFVYSTNTNPSISDNKVTISGTTGQFTGTLTNLLPNTIYYFKTFATNSVGTGYGDIVTLTTKNCIWVEDSVPTGATSSSDGNDSWNWITTNPTPYSGTKDHKSNSSTGEHQHYFSNASSTLYVPANATLYTYVYLDSQTTPSEVMLQWNDGSWEHRAYWGSNSIGWGTNGTISRIYMGILPEKGKWVRLEVPASQVGLENRTLNGMAFTLYGGIASWDMADCSVNTIPVVTTNKQVTDNTATSAIVSGMVSYDGGSSVTERGIVYSTSQNPTINDSKVSTSGTIGTFSVNLTSLQDNTKYYARSYATNLVGTAYGDVVSFNTLDVIAMNPISHDLRISDKFEFGDIVPLVIKVKALYDISDPVITVDLSLKKSDGSDSGFNVTKYYKNGNLLIKAKKVSSGIETTIAPQDISTNGNELRVKLPGNYLANDEIDLYYYVKLSATTYVINYGVNKYLNDTGLSNSDLDLFYEISEWKYNSSTYGPCDKNTLGSSNGFKASIKMSDEYSER